MPVESAFASFVNRPFHVFRRFAPRRLFWLGLPLLLYSWTLAGPFVGDDLNLVLKAERYLRGKSAAPMLYRIATNEAEWQTLRDRGTVPWWIPGGAHLDFFRPVSEAAFLIDVRLFGRNPFGPRLISLLVLAVALLCVHWLFREAGADALRAGFATFLFGVSQTVTPPATWLCNRQDLFVVIGVASSSAVYWAARRRARAWHLPLAVLACGFALLSKEVAVGLAAVVGFHELIEWRRSPRRHRHGDSAICDRARANNGFRPAATGFIAGAIVLLTAGFLTYYAYSRPGAFGTKNGEGIPSILSSNLPIAILLYLAVWVWGVPIDVMHVAPDWAVYCVAGGAAVLGFLFVRYARRASKGDAAAIFFTLWTICFILPGLKSLTTSTRTLCTGTVGWSYFAAVLLVPKREEDVIVPLWFRQGLFGADVVVSIIAAVVTVLWMNQWEMRARENLQAAIRSADPPVRDGDALIVERSDSAMEAICAGDRLEFLTGLRDVAVCFLLGPDTTADIRRTGPSSLQLVSTDSSLFGSTLHRVSLRRDWTPAPGKCLQLREFTAAIGEVRGARDIRSIDLNFKKPLDSPSLHFYPAQLAEIAHPLRHAPGASPSAARPKTKAHPGGSQATRHGESQATGKS